MSDHYESTKFEGSGRQVHQSHREFDDGNVFPKADFFEPNLIDATPPAFASPPIAEQLVGDLRAHRLLVFGGPELQEKPLLARHLAWLLRRELCAENHTEEHAVEIQQWHPSSVPTHLDDAFARPEKVTIFIFPAIQPYHLGYDLRHFLDAVTAHKHYAIIATDSVLSQWSPDAGLTEKGIWREYATGDLFDPDYLVAVLCQRLEEVRGCLAKGFLAEGLPQGDERDAPLVANLSIREAAVELKTPSRIRSFVATLCADDAVASEEWVREKLDQLGGSRHGVHQWFQQFDHRDQLLALALGLFDGLFDDQVFAALEVLIQSAWRAWDPMLSHFDYHELGKAGGYFNGTEVDTQTTRIECSSAENRKALFEVAWKLHRRRILATLPLLVEMVGDSTFGPSPHHDNDDQQVFDKLEQASRTDEDGKETSEDGAGSQSRPLSADETRHSRWQQHGAWRDLFGSAVRSVQFRRVAALTLSQLGLLSEDAVERTLLDLAEDGRPDVQIVAASALASWRAAVPVEENSRKLFRLLAAWQGEARQKEHAQRRRRRDRRVVAPLAHIRATVALTVSYASLYDRPNHLTDKLYELVERFVEDRSPIVRRRVCSHTLPVVVAGHFAQLEKLLWDKVLLEPDLLYGAASGMAIAYLLRPRETLPILENWCARALNSPAQDLARDQLTRRETALATVVLAYGRIPPGEGKEALAPHQIFERLQTILTRESHPFVRSAVLLAMTLQARNNLEQAAPLMQRLVSEVALEERSLVIDRLKEIYLEQRREQGDGEDQLTVGGVRYPTWIKEKRPPTAIEKMLYEWIQDYSEPVAQQLAFEALAVFTETPLEKEERRREDARRKKAEDEDEPDAATEAAELRDPKKRTRRTPILGRVAVFFAALTAPEMRAILPPLLPEYLRRHPDSLPRRLFTLVQETWREENPDWKKLFQWETLEKVIENPAASEHPMDQRLRWDVDNGGEDLARTLRRAANLYHWRWVIAGMGLVLALISGLFLQVIS